MIWLGLLAVVAFLTACGQILFKFAAMRDVSFFQKFTDWRFVSGVGLFLICPFLTILALKHVEYSCYYATTALNYVFVIFGTRCFLKEHIDARKIIGIVLILVGLIFYMVK